MQEIKFDKSNYRKHNNRNKNLINKSLKECGAGRSIVIDNDGEIIAGNGIYEQAQKLKIPTKIIETDGSELVVVKRTDLKTDDEKRKQLAIMDNSTSDSSEFDLDSLQSDFEIEQLQDWGLDLEFETADEEKEIIEDEVPEEVGTRCKLGDIWQLGNHRLMCGDSTNITDVEKLMNGEKADMVFTDPPYGMNLDTDYSKRNWEKKNTEFSQRKNVVCGKQYEPGLVDVFNPQMINLILSLDVKEVFLWGADYFAELLPNKNDGSWLVWDKRDDNEQFDKMFGSSFELCWSKEKHKRDIARIRWCGVFGTEKEFDKKRFHPTQKPTALVQWFLDRYSKENQIILDLYGGSGSTLITCEQLDRKCYMMELDSHYCDVIIQRWENFTGQKAVLLNG